MSQDEACKLTKNGTVELRKKTMTKWKSNLKPIKSQDLSCYYGKTGKLKQNT